LPISEGSIFAYTPRGQVFGFLKYLELHGHQALHLIFETGTEFTDAGIDTVSKNVETVVIFAIQNLFFDESP
jgi:hypothetical protein